MSLHRERTTT